MTYIQSKQNTRVKAWKKLHKKKGRDEERKFLIEGYHLIEEALRLPGVVETLLVADDAHIPDAWHVKGIEVCQLSSYVLEVISQTQHSQGVMAVCRQFTEGIASVAGGQFLLCDAIQDPGNLGTMIRTADALGLSGVVLGDGCVDVYNDKVVRSTQGSLFQIPIITESLPMFIEKCRGQYMSIYGTSLSNGVSIRDVDVAESFALIIGNEAAGLSASLLDQTDKNIYIPITGQAQSFNAAVATGILLYTMTTR